jgi:hypothetical protein
MINGKLFVLYDANPPYIFLTFNVREALQAMMLTAHHDLAPRLVQEWVELYLYSPIRLHEVERDKLNCTKSYQTMFAPSKLREIQDQGQCLIFRAPDPSYRIYFRFKLIKAVNMNIFVFLDVTPCILVVYRRFRLFATVSVGIP